MYEAHVTVDVEESLNERLENLASREGLTLHKFTMPKLNGQGYFVETMLSSRLFSPLHVETLLRREFRSDTGKDLMDKVNETTRPNVEELLARAKNKRAIG